MTKKKKKENLHFLHWVLITYLGKNYLSSHFNTQCSQNQAKNYV